MAEVLTTAPVVADRSDMDWTREPLWLSTAEAGRRLGVTPRTVYSFINDGSLPGYRIGRKIQVLAADVDEFIEQSRIEPSGPSQR